MNLEQIIGKNVRRLRKLKKWSQDDLAREYDCLKAYVSQIENGKTWIGRDVFYKLCDLLDAKPEDLIKTYNCNVEPLLIAKIKHIRQSEYGELFDLMVDVLKDYEYADPLQFKEQLAEIRGALKAVRAGLLGRKSQPPVEPGRKLSNSAED